MTARAPVTDAIGFAERPPCLGLLDVVLERTAGGGVDSRVPAVSGLATAGFSVW